MFGIFLNKAAEGVLPDRNLTQLETPLHHAILESVDTKDLFEIFMEFIQNGDSDVISPYTHLCSMDFALSKVSLDNTLFLTLCTDVIQRSVFGKGSLDEVKSIESASDNLMSTFRYAVEILENLSNISLLLAVAAAYIREFLYQLSENMKYDSQYNQIENHKVLYQNVGAVLDSPSGKVFQKFLIKELKFEKTLDGVKKFLSNFEMYLSSLKKIELPEDDLSLSLGHFALGKSAHRTPELEIALLNLDKDEHIVLDYLKGKSTEKILQLIQSLLHVVYVPCSLRSLNDTEKQLGTWMQSKADSLPNSIKSLVQRITSIESFGINWFKFTPDMPCLQLQQVGILLHLASIVIGNRPDDNCHLLSECILQPLTVIKVDIASHVASLETGLRGGGAELFEFVMCRCWSRIISSRNRRWTTLSNVWNRMGQINIAKECVEIFNKLC